MSYKKIEGINNLLLQKDTYLFGSISEISKSILLFSCIVILPLLLLIAQASFDTSAQTWLTDLILFLITAVILIIFFAAIIKIQLHFFQKNTLKELSTLCNIHLIQKHSLFSPKYFAAFAFDTKIVALGNHYNHTYLIKNLNDLHYWKIVHYLKKPSEKPNTSHPKQRKLSVLTIYFKETVEQEEKNYMFTFKLSLIKAKFWEKILQKNCPQTQTIRILTT